MKLKSSCKTINGKHTIEASQHDLSCVHAFVCHSLFRVYMFSYSCVCCKEIEHCLVSRGQYCTVYI